MRVLVGAVTKNNKVQFAPMLHLLKFSCLTHRKITRWDHSIVIAYRRLKLESQNESVENHGGDVT